MCKSYCKSREFIINKTLFEKQSEIKMWEFCQQYPMLKSLKPTADRWEERLAFIYCKFILTLPLLEPTEMNTLSTDNKRHIQKEPIQTFYSGVFGLAFNTLCLKSEWGKWRPIGDREVITMRRPERSVKYFYPEITSWWIIINKQHL